jgi:hypothetical protein
MATAMSTLSFTSTDALDRKKDDGDEDDDDDDDDDELEDEDDDDDEWSCARRWASCSCRKALFSSVLFLCMRATSWCCSFRTASFTVCLSRVRISTSLPPPRLHPLLSHLHTTYIP